MQTQRAAFLRNGMITLLLFVALRLEKIML